MSLLGNDAKEKAKNLKRLQWAVFKEAIQHPTTVFPLAVSAVSGMYLGLINFSSTPFMLTIGAGLLGLASWTVHYFFRYDKIAEKHLQKLRNKDLNKIHEEAKSLSRECYKNGFSEAGKEVKELEQSFIQVWTFLKQEEQKNQNPSAVRFLSLAEDSYREGLVMLKSALETFKLLKTLDHKKLQKELVAWMAEIKRYEKDPERYNSQIRSLKKRIQSHQNRLGLYRQKMQQIHEYLAQSEVIEAALETTLLEANDLMRQGEIKIQTEAASRLEQAVSSARRVEEKLRTMGQNQPQDDMYLEAAKSIHKEE